jgi:hypothetical protein
MKVPIGIVDEWKSCGCGMNACCGECLRKERRRHLAVLRLAPLQTFLDAIPIAREKMIAA